MSRLFVNQTLPGMAIWFVLLKYERIWKVIFNSHHLPSMDRWIILIINGMAVADELCSSDPATDSHRLTIAKQIHTMMGVAQKFNFSP